MYKPVTIFIHHLDGVARQQTASLQIPQASYQVILMIITKVSDVFLPSQQPGHLLGDHRPFPAGGGRHTSINHYSQQCTHQELQW